MEEGQEAGEWKCLRILGRGSFGIVGLWKNKLGEVTALKQFDSRCGSNEVPDSTRILNEMESRWRKEVEMMYEEIKSPYIVSTEPVPKDLLVLSSNPRRPNLPLPLLCMEFCSGGDLRQLLRRPENISGLPEVQVRAILSHIQHAISYLHERKIVHRDLKPENILIQPNNGQPIYKLSDLGFAKNLSNSESFCSTVVGTLQYLAPEIYMGKNYDKTVDFWSFGLIAFEISCGMRPFLHGESPARWYPYVEEKAKNVIAIYRTEKGGVEYSTSIPYNTHLSELFKKCFETWLKMMLQFEPSRRGRRVLMAETKEAESSKDFQQIVGLSVLHNILQTQMLTIYCPSRKLAFAIGRSTIVYDIMQWICRDINVAIADQMIFTTDGTKLDSGEHVLKYINAGDLFMIPKRTIILHQLKMKLKIPKCVNKFLTAWDTVRDPLVLRKVWISVVYFVKTEVEQMEMLKKASEALLKWRTTWIATVLKPYVSEVEKIIASTDKIFEFETRLEKIDAEFGARIEGDSQGLDSRTRNMNDWLEEKESMKGWNQDAVKDFKEHIVLKPAMISELEEIYQKILKTYDDWRENSGSVHIESLVRSLCLFIAQRDPVVDTLERNISMQSEQLLEDERFMDRIRTTDESLSGLMHELMQSRSQKQNKLLEKVFGKPVPVNKAKKSTPVRMTKSDLVTSEQEKIPAPEESAMSLDRVDPANMNVSLELSSLMQQSQILDLETEDTLTNALKQAQDMLLAKEKMDWEFLG